MNIITSASGSESARRLAALAQLLGAHAKLASLDGARAARSTPQLAQVVDVSAVAQLPHGAEMMRTFLAGRGPQDVPALLMVETGGARVDRLLSDMSAGRLVGVDSIEQGSEVRCSDLGQDVIGPLSGQVFRRVLRRALVFRVGAESEGIELMSVDGRPTFVWLREQGLFVWAVSDVFDIAMPITEEFHFEGRVDSYVPAIAYLRRALGNRVWHNPNPSAALVIDDPLLVERYGCLDFPRLLSSAQRLGYVVSLAFIPWNHFRSRTAQVDRLRQWGDRLALCVHGCDHTADEYGAVDIGLLMAKNAVALERMQHHERRTGMTFEPVMVYPQEEFSLQAIQSIASSGDLLAVANSRCIARESGAIVLAGKDLLSPAQDRYCGVPILKRYYPADRALLALGLFLGKPAVVAEHHGFFRDGVSRAEELISWIASLPGSPRWTSIGGVARGVCAVRHTETDALDLKIFCDRFEPSQFTASGDALRVFRRIPRDSQVESVLINGEAVAFAQADDQLTFEAVAAERTTLRIQVNRRRPSPSASLRYPGGLGYHARVALRRLLSESRDRLQARFPRMG